MLQTRPGPRQPALVSDGATLAFPPQALLGRADELDPQDAVVASLLKYLQGLAAPKRAQGRSKQADAAAQTPSLAGWRLLARTDGEALFGRGRPPQLLLVTLRKRGLRRSWSCTSSGVARQLRAVRDGIRASSWRVDPEHELGSQDTELRVLLTEQAFASGQSAEGRVLEPELYLDGEELLLRMFVTPRPGYQTATRNPETPVRIVLPEPVGARRLLDGAVPGLGAGAGLQNFRDVGGMSTSSGEHTRSGVLYRSDAPRAGDPPPAGVRWPPATVVDLRSPQEAGGGHPLAGAGSEVHAIPLMAEAGIVRLAAAPPDLGGGVAGLYRRTLSHVGPHFASVARLVADSRGPTLIHCTAGKDRTGLVVAVLLASVGVEREQIIADYTRTQANMPGVLERIASTPGLRDGPALLQRVRQTQPEILTAPEAAIEAALDVIEESGGARAWLQQHGLSEDDQARLHERLVEG